MSLNVIARAAPRVTLVRSRTVERANFDLLRKRILLRY
jgi:hypothetical protein